MKFQTILLVLLITLCVLNETTARRWIRIRARIGIDIKRKQKNRTIDPLPCNFSAWDKNEDSGIDIQEFFDMVQYDERLLQAFKTGDENGNGFLSPSELLNTPVVFEKC